MTTDHNIALIERHKRRLYTLELQAATTGNETPPHILTEIDDIRAKIKALENVARLPGDDNRLNVMVATVGAINDARNGIQDEVALLKDRFELLINDVDELKEHTKLFEELVSSSVNAFHMNLSTQFQSLQRWILTVVVAGIILALVIAFK